MTKPAHHSLTRRLAVLAFVIGIPAFGILVPVLYMVNEKRAWDWWPLFWFGVWLAGPLVVHWLLKQGSGNTS